MIGLILIDSLGSFLVNSFQLFKFVKMVKSCSKLVFYGKNVFN